MRSGKILVIAAFAALMHGRAAAGESPDPLRLLYSCRDTCKKIEDYTGTFTRREFLEGELADTEILFVKFRQEPLSMYAKWIGELYKGREGIYVKGKNDDMIIGHEYIGPLNITKKVKVDGPEAKSNSRRPIAEAGLLGTIRTFVRYVEIGQQNKDMRLCYVGIDTFDGRPVHVILRIMEKREDYPAYLEFIYIDKERLLPVKCVGYDWDYKLLWLYSNVDLKLNVGLTDKDFDPESDQYNYPRLIAFNIPKLF